MWDSGTAQCPRATQLSLSAPIINIHILLIIFYILPAVLATHRTICSLMIILVIIVNKIYNYFFLFLLSIVRQLHREFLRAGADVIQAFTFSMDDDLDGEHAKYGVCIVVCTDSIHAPPKVLCLDSNPPLRKIPSYVFWLNYSHFFQTPPSAYERPLQNFKSTSSGCTVDILLHHALFVSLLVFFFLLFLL